MEIVADAMEIADTDSTPRRSVYGYRQRRDQAISLHLAG
jgi:hypothetical protein